MRRFLSLISRFLGRGILIFLLGYAFFLLGRSVYFNYQTNQQIASLGEQIEVIKQDKESLQNLILYYQTDSFKELEARRQLGLKKPGELVVALPENKEQREVEEKKPPKAEEKQKEDNFANPLKWWNFVFGK